MTPAVIAELSKPEKSELHTKILNLCLDDIKRSRGVMSKNYRLWDLQDEVYRGERCLDADDARTAAKSEPVKMILPTTHSQIMTFTSFLFLMFKQNDTFFSLKPTGEEDYGKKWSDCETVLSRDMRHSRESAVLFQHLLDIPRFGMAPMELTWTKETAKIFVEGKPVTQTIMGQEVTVPTPSAWQLLTKYEGNTVKNVSPYRWFPDTSFPLRDFHLGDFCASEEDFTMGGLKTLQAGDEVAGVEHIQGLPRNLSEARGGESRMSFTLPNAFDPQTSTAPVCVTKVRRKIVPKDFMLDDSRPLGAEEFQVLYTIWIANDNRVIRLEPSGEWHSEFGYAVGQFTPDMHRTVTLGLADLIYPLQDAMSWFLNSHITSVRRVIQNRNIINPAFVETKSYDGEGDIFIRRGVGRIDPRMAVAQLPAQDVTGSHMGDVATLNGLMQMVTGVNDQMQGQYSQGRRSATQDRTVAAGAAGRMKMHGHLIWEQALGRIGRLMLSNSRQSLSFESFVRAVGGNLADPEKAQEMAQRFATFQGSPEEIVCGDDYLQFDATLSSEKGYMAQNLQELLSLILTTNPLAAQMIGATLDPAKIVDEMQYLRDGTPVSRFAYSAEQKQQMMMMQQTQLQREQQQKTQPAPSASAA